MPTGMCPLCKLEKEVVRSHWIPRGVYDYIRAPDEDPIIMTNQVVMFSGRHIKDYLLCHDCENILNAGGETWTIPLLADIDGRFPLHDILMTRRVDVGDEALGAFYTALNPDFRSDMLAHFGLGIFWKSSVHSWTHKKSESRIDLGPYGDGLRLYLRKEGSFPKQMALNVSIAPRPVKLITIDLPGRTSMTGCHHFRFYVPGIQYDLFVGKAIQEYQKKCCVVSAPGHPVLLLDLSESMSRTAREVARKAHIAKRVKDYRRNLKADS